MIKMRKLRWIALSFLVGALTGVVAQLAYTHLHRGSYEDCILEREPHAGDRLAAYLIEKACDSKYQVKQYEVPSVSDLSFGKNDRVLRASKPISATDDRGWAVYLQQLVQNNLQGLSDQQITPYLVNAGDADADKASRDRQLQTVQDTVARGVLPGYALAFAGPESAKTADLIVAAFKDAKPGSFNKVIIIFIGDPADQQRVEDALKPSGATFRFVPMT